SVAGQAPQLVVGELENRLQRARLAVVHPADQIGQRGLLLAHGSDHDTAWQEMQRTEVSALPSTLVSACPQSAGDVVARDIWAVLSGGNHDDVRLRQACGARWGVRARGRMRRRRRKWR